MRIIGLLLFMIVYGIDIERIPTTNPPPSSRIFPIMESFPSYDCIIVYSGNSNPSTIYNDIWLFNITLFQWERLSPSNDEAPVPRYNGGSFKSESKRLLYIFGGMSQSGPLNDLWCFQADGSLWEKVLTKGNIPPSRMRFGYDSYNDEYGNSIFAVFGGITGSGTDNSLYLLNITTWTWKAMKPTNLPPKLEGPSLRYYDKKLYLAGGYATYLKDPNIKTTFYYDLSTNDWVNITTSKTYSPRLHQGNFIYKDEWYLMTGYSLPKSSLDTTWYKLDLTSSSYDWVEVQMTEDTENITRQDSYGYGISGDMAFTFAGNKIPDISNRLVIYNLKNEIITYYALPEDTSPSPRMYHSLEPMGRHLYTFGGLSDNGELLNDLWLYDTIDDYWQIKVPIGDIPSKRHSYASASDGDHMLIWGGNGQEGYLNDGYFYNINTNTYVALTYKGKNPSPRVGACIVMHEENIYLYGGLTNAGLSDEFWYYSINTQTYKLLDSGNSNGPGPLIYPRCSLSTTVSNLIYVLYGESEDLYPTNEIYGFNAKSLKWKQFYSIDTSIYAKSRAAVLKLPNIVIAAGGESEATYPTNGIYAYNIKSDQWTFFGVLPYSTFGPASTYFKNYFYIHGGGTAEYTLLRFSVPSNKFIKIDLKSLCTTADDCDFTCSPGTFNSSSSCEVCEAGTYSGEFGKSSCTPCTKGKYGPHDGTTTGDMCYPCQQGQFNDKEGKSYCNDCPGGATCNIGSLTYNYNITDYNDTFVQPAIYKTNQETVAKNNLITGVVVGALGCLVILSLIIVRRNRKHLLSCDLYSEMHNHFERELMYIKRRKIGGVFGIMFIFIAIAIIEISFVNYLKKNVFETKSLVPLVVLKQDVSKFEGNFYITITLMNYGGTCVNYNSLNEMTCPSSISHTIDGINGNWEEQDCELLDNGDCVITINCVKCSINTQGNIFYTMDDSNGYTSGFIVNVTSSSSIPGKASSYKTAVLPDNNYLFFGGTTVIYYDMVPSYYEDTINNNNDTGYHVDLKQVSSTGTQYQAFELGYAFINYLELELDLNRNGLVTNKGAKQTFIMLISSLLGSVFAVLGILGGIMKQTEDIWLKINKLVNHEKKVVKSRKNAENIFSAYGGWMNNNDEEEGMSAGSSGPINNNIEK
ncbi:RABEPK [Blepharisma stoltei]|uniref:Tyrosine-protein kinase ephrin type A/B receptor-like domain-containing protein n=1 Tax=Blepharisma stoltei TaxID=1481888 RepID=A0AAU9J8C9_9CILI|nr:unnamed protein product [Blepharisma stoltei]